MSAGFICPKGSGLKQLHEDPDRLRTPLIKENGTHRPATWEEAYALIDRRFGEITSEHGRNAAAIYLGNPNVHQFENTIAIRGLVKALGTQNVYSASTVDQMPKHLSAGLMFGHPLNIPVPDLDRTDYLLMLGANPYESNGSLCTAPDFPRRLQSIRDRGGKVVVVDPRRTKTARNADRWLPIRPGTDPAFLLALINLVIADQDNSPLRDVVSEFTSERVSSFTGITPEEIERVAAELMSAPSAAVYSRIGTHTAPFGTLSSWAVDVLNFVTGNLDRPGGAMFPYPAHLSGKRSNRPFRFGRWLSRVSGRPEVLGELPVASLIEEMTTPGEGKVRMLVTVAGNPALTTPNSGALARALDDLDFMVSVDPYLNSSSRFADVVLPVPSALERSHYDLAFTGFSVRDYADYSPAVFPTDAPGEFEILLKLGAIFSGFGPEADPEILAAAALAGAVQSEVGNPASNLAGRDGAEIIGLLGDRPWPERFLDLLLRAGHRGDHFGTTSGDLSLDLLEANPHGIDFGPLEPRLQDLLCTESGEVELAPELIISDLPRLSRAMTESPQEPLLIGRRQVRTANSWTHNVETLVKGREQCTLEVNPIDAEAWGLIEGSKARVISVAGEVVLPIEITEDISPGVVSFPYGWGHGQPGARMQVAAAHAGVNVNLLSDGTIDEVSGNAVLNAIPVTVSAA